MKPMMKPTRSILKTLVAGTALVMAGSAFAQVYVAPPPPQPRYEGPAPAHGVTIALGWHGERYWDGHRYWERDEWMHNHPHDREAQRDRDHDHEHHEY